MRALRRPRFFYGWYIVAVAFLSLFLAGGVGTAFSVLLPAMARDLAWSYSTLVAASSIGVIIGAITGPLVGRIVDERGARAVLVVSAVATAATATAAGLVREPWQLYLAYGVVGGAARSAMMNVAPGAMIANWFLHARPLASGIAAMGPPASSLVLPPLIAVTVTAATWQNAWMGLGAAVLALAVPPALLLVRRRPEDLGLLPDGAAAHPGTSGQATAGHAVAARHNIPSDGDWTLREAIHARGFWGIALSMALIGLMPHTVFLFLPSSFLAQGLSETAAASSLSMMGLTQVVSRVALWTPLVTRLGSVQRALLLWGGLLLSSALLLSVARGEVPGLLASGFLGLAMGGNLVLQLLIWPEYFGRRAVGAISGVAHLLSGASGALGPLVGAALLDLTGNYSLLYLFMAASVLAGLLLQAIVGRPRKE